MNKQGKRHLLFPCLLRLCFLCLSPNITRGKALPYIVKGRSHLLKFRFHLNLGRPPIYWAFAPQSSEVEVGDLLLSLEEVRCFACLMHMCLGKTCLRWSLSPHRACCPLPNVEQEKQDGSEISHAILSSGMFYASRIKILNVYILVKIVNILRYGKSHQRV